MKLLCIIDSLGSGGAQRQMLAIANKMVQRGHDVAVAWYADDDFYKKNFENGGVVGYKGDGSSILSRILFLHGVLKKVTPDTTLAFLTGPSFICCILKFLSIKKWRLVISIRGNNEQRFNNRKNKFIRLFFREAEAIICNSHSEAEVWKKNCAYLSEKVSVIPNFVHVPVTEGQGETKSRGKITVLIPANLQSWIKNPLNVAKALQLLSPEERQKICIEWFGRRYERNQLSEVCYQVEKYIHENALTESFHIHDETHDIYNEMKKCDFVALFSTEEGLPNAICEGMLLGKPVIMTKVSDWKELINGNGFVCEGMDAENIAKSLRQAINASTENIELMGKRSKELAEAMFNVESTAKRWDSVLFENSI